MMCPVGGLELYVRICALLGIEPGLGYLFRPLSKTGTVSSQCMTSQAAQTRLNVYSVSLQQQLTGGHFTLHGFRSGAAVSMASVDLHAIMDHVGWKYTIKDQNFTAKSIPQLHAKDTQSFANSFRTNVFKINTKTSTVSTNTPCRFTDDYRHKLT